MTRDGGPGADIIIPDVPDDVIAAADVKAQRLGLSRDSFLRRVLVRERNIQSSEVSVDELRTFCELPRRDLPVPRPRFGVNSAWPNARQQ